LITGVGFLDDRPTRLSNGSLSGPGGKRVCRIHPGTRAENHDVLAKDPRLPIDHHHSSPPPIGNRARSQTEARRQSGQTDTTRAGDQFARRPRRSHPSPQNPRFRIPIPSKHSREIHHRARPNSDTVGEWRTPPRSATAGEMPLGGVDDHHQPPGPSYSAP